MQQAGCRVQPATIWAWQHRKTRSWKPSYHPSCPPGLTPCCLQVGAVFTAGFCGDAPLVVAAGGSKGTVTVWDTATNPAVAAFAQRQQQEAGGGTGGGQ